jgi:hypothetical protein
MGSRGVLSRVIVAACADRITHRPAERCTRGPRNVLWMSETAEKSDGAPPAMATISLFMPPAHIALFKAIVESYDNLATLRTDDPRIHRLKLSFAPTAAADVEELLEAVGAALQIQRI